MATDDIRAFAVDVQNGAAYGGNVRGRRTGKPAISAVEHDRRHFRFVRHLRSSLSLVGADESYRAHDTLEEGMTPGLELPSTFAPDRIAGASMFWPGRWRGGSRRRSVSATSREG